MPAMEPEVLAVSPSGKARLISREEMANLPIRRYEGNVCVIATPQDLDRAQADILQEHVVGLDTETRPAFKKGEKHLPCLVQIATGSAAYLFQLRRTDGLPLIARLLSEPRIIKAGVALAHDLRELKLVFPFTERGVLDLGVLARRCGLEQTGVRNLAGMFLGWRVPKGARTSNWATPRLTSQQISYAATDAWICRELFLRFKELGLVQRMDVEKGAVKSIDAKEGRKDGNQDLNPDS
jgi:ribonuclease D